MQYIYHERAKDDYLNIDGDLYKYLFRVRRHKQEERVNLRNLEDNNIYEYEIITISKRDAELKLLSSKESIVKANKDFHLGWCVVDPKTVEKSITSLNEIGVDRISFIYSDYSQKNFKVNLEKLEKILINSSQQCGRSTIMKLDIYRSLEEFLVDFPDALSLDFSDKRVGDFSEIKTLVVGTEGGFSESERELFSNRKVGLDSNLILKSESAAIAISSKILL